MKSPSLTVLIPAFKKTVAFQDDLVKKLSGSSLIQRAINKIVELGVEKIDIHIFTDSEEICLIAERNGIQAFWNPKLIWGDSQSLDFLKEQLDQFSSLNQYMLLFSPYMPLLDVNTILNAISALIKSKRDILKPVKQVKKHIFDSDDQQLFEILFGVENKSHLIDLKAFTIFRSTLLQSNWDSIPSILRWPIDHDLIEIESYQDWWVCEKLINRKRIIFRVIGNDIVGTGHIFRALTLAHEITDHEIIFVCDTNNEAAVNKLAGYDYRLEIVPPNKIIDYIINLKPDLVINDILSTKVQDVTPLQDIGIKVANFEDLGAGAKLSNLTINELYDEPKYNSKNTLWGHSYFFVRDEFNDAKVNQFKKQIDSILLVFGGTDQHNLTLEVYRSIKDFCNKRSVRINIVIGKGYKYFNKLKNEVINESNVSLTNATGVISKIMEDSQVAVTANGRTVYELAHMNIPAIVISQHEREDTHSFSCQSNGFVSVGVYKKNHTKNEVKKYLEQILDDEVFRKKLFEGTKKFRFNNNKHKVVKKLLELL